MPINRKKGSAPLPIPRKQVKMYTKGPEIPTAFKQQKQKKKVKNTEETSPNRAQITLFSNFYFDFL